MIMAVARARVVRTAAEAEPARMAMVVARARGCGAGALCQRGRFLVSFP